MDDTENYTYTEVHPIGTLEATPKESPKIKEDLVNSPSHYGVFPDKEAIDIIEASLTPTEFIGYLKGNALKYRLRAGDKNPKKLKEDISKSQWYQKRLREEFNRGD
jgi:hypothetical protein